MIGTAWAHVVDLLEKAHRGPIEDGHLEAAHNQFGAWEGGVSREQARDILKLAGRAKSTRAYNKGEGDPHDPMFHAGRLQHELDSLVRPKSNVAKREMAQGVSGALPLLDQKQIGMNAQLWADHHERVDSGWPARMPSSSLKSDPLPVYREQRSNTVRSRNAFMTSKGFDPMVQMKDVHALSRAVEHMASQPGHDPQLVNSARVMHRALAIRQISHEDQEAAGEIHHGFSVSWPALETNALRGFAAAAKHLHHTDERRLTPVLNVALAAHEAHPAPLDGTNDYAPLSASPKSLPDPDRKNIIAALADGDSEKKSGRVASKGPDEETADPKILAYRAEKVRALARGANLKASKPMGGRRRGASEDAGGLQALGETLRRSGTSDSVDKSVIAEALLKSLESFRGFLHAEFPDV